MPDIFFLPLIIMSGAFSILTIAIGTDGGRLELDNITKSVSVFLMFIAVFSIGLLIVYGLIPEIRSEPIVTQVKSVGNVDCIVYDDTIINLNSLLGVRLEEGEEIEISKVLSGPYMGFIYNLNLLDSDAYIIHYNSNEYRIKINEQQN